MAFVTTPSARTLTTSPPRPSSFAPRRPRQPHRPSRPSPPSASRSRTTSVLPPPSAASSILATVASTATRLPTPVLSPADQRAVLLRLLVAVAGGSFIGAERHAAGAIAGLRTTALVSLGSAVFTLIGLLVYGGGSEAARVAAQIVSGVGFIGAGCITSTRPYPSEGANTGGPQRRGLSTASGIWISAAIGVAAATGLFAVALFASALTVAVLRYSTVRRWVRRTFERNFRSSVADGSDLLGKVPAKQKGHAIVNVVDASDLEEVLRQSRIKDRKSP